jgi:hypothetical protein
MLYYLDGMTTKDSKERFVAVVPAGQKFVKPKKTGGASRRAAFALHTAC